MMHEEVMHTTYDVRIQRETIFQDAKVVSDPTQMYNTRIHILVPVQLHVISLYSARTSYCGGTCDNYCTSG